jgi:putative membrane protein
MKSIKAIIGVLLSIVIFQACNHKSKNKVGGADSALSLKDSVRGNIPDSTGMLDTTAQLPFGLTKKDTAFAYVAASQEITEVELGKIAQQRAAGRQVKAFGAIMVREHSKANDTLQAIARKQGIILPNAPMRSNQQTVDTLLKLKGKDFDKAYMHQMIGYHKNDIRTFEYESKHLKDSALRAFTIKTLPVLKKQLRLARSVSLK